MSLPGSPNFSSFSSLVPVIFKVFHQYLIFLGVVLVMYCCVKKHIKMYWLKKQTFRSGQDGGRVRHGDHLPSHRYIRNTSTCGTAPTEHPLNAGRRRQTSQKARNSPRTWVGQKKKEITETKE